MRRLLTRGGAAAFARICLVAICGLLATSAAALGASQAPDPDAVREEMRARGIPASPGPQGEARPLPAAVARRERPPRYGPEQYVRGLGNARYDSANGVYAVRHPSGKLVETHGPDPAGAVNSAQVNMPADTTYKPVCTGGSGHRIVLVYAWPRGGTNNYASGQHYARAFFDRANTKLVREAVRSSGFGRAASYKVQCDAAGVPIVLGIETYAHGTDTNPRSPNNVQQSILDYYNPSGANAVKFVTFMDSSAPGGYSGVAYSWLSDTYGAYVKDRNQNYNALYSTAAITYQPYWPTHTVMHEAGHVLGAVQQHWNWFSTGAGHCVDGDDVMCYNDGGPNAHHYSSNTCPDAQYSQPDTFPFDCRYDTYFKTVPGPSGSWLNQFWQVGGAEDDFLSYNPPW